VPLGISDRPVKCGAELFGCAGTATLSADDGETSPKPTKIFANYLSQTISKKCKVCIDGEISNLPSRKSHTVVVRIHKSGMPVLQSTGSAPYVEQNSITNPIRAQKLGISSESRFKAELNRTGMPCFVIFAFPGE